MPTNNPYVPYVERFEKSSEFSYLSNFFSKEEVYTNIPQGTYEYREFWEDVKFKCMYGFTNSVGISISGPHFYYLNFCPILGYNEATGRKSKIFPKFVDLDYEKFWMAQYCRTNQKSLISVKGRRQGWSYYAAALCSHEFSFYPDSKCVIGAFMSSFSQNTMNMVVDNLNFLNTNTEFRKQRNPDLKDNIVAKYQVDIGGVKVWKGYQSGVRSISYKDNPTASVGLTANWLVLDEAGVFNNISETWGYSEPLIKDGSIYTGVGLIFGSSGNMDSGSKYFYEMFMNPGKYNCLEFRDPDDPNKIIGFFSSACKGRWGKCLNPNSKWYKHLMVDIEGNSNEEAAADDILYLREQKRSGLDPKALHSAITQFPLSYKEAFLRDKGAVFASVEMLEWLGKLETTPSIRDNKKKIELYFDHDGVIKEKLNPDLIEITNYPLGKDESKNGCIVVYEDPMPNPQYGLYIAGCDPYDQDKADTSESLGSFIIYKRFVHNGTTHNIMVCEYTGRPGRADEFYETCRRLCIYYNAKCLYENQLKGLKAYFEMKNSLHYLCEQPQIIKDIVKDSKVNRGYGIHMNRGVGSTSTGIKDQCELYLHQWLYEERVGDDGSKIMNMHTIRSIGLLKELIAYDREANCDRVVALMLCILQSKEMHKLYLEDTSSKSLLDMETFFTRKLYQKNIHNKIRY